MNEFSLRNAHIAEAGALSEIAFRSKQHWGYPTEFMQACRDELTYTSQDLESANTRYVVAETEGNVAGFYALLTVDGDSAELDAIFVDPDYIGRGIGTALLQHALGVAHSQGLAKIIIQADPNAAAFYEAAGALACGERESDSIPGRMLPLFKFDIHARQAD